MTSRRLLAVSGVANPAEFAVTLAELGLAPEERLDFRDHQRYGPRQIASIQSAADRTGASLLITTEKDAVRLPEAWRDRVATWPVRARFADEAALDALLARVLG